MEEFWTSDTLQEEVVEALIIELPGEESDMFEDDYSEEEASDSDAYFLINFHLFFLYFFNYVQKCLQRDVFRFLDFQYCVSIGAWLLTA